ncbi:MAG: hypothetical protein KUG77_10240 [Nannocystaceae bacterium]|nr:hypothetical protein [Nannocystaceae bacterium]
MAEVSPTIWVWVGLAALPLVLALCTAFTKSLVVVGALRTGLGAEAFLPWPIVLAVASVITGVVMLPVAGALALGVEAVGGFEAVLLSPAEHGPALLQPLLEFTHRHADPVELEFFSELQGRPVQQGWVSVPAFLITELTEALAIAVVILVPFVLADLVVGQALTLGGLASVPQPLVSVPVKLLLFLAVGGWDVVIGGLVKGYA